MMSIWNKVRGTITNTSREMPPPHVMKRLTPLLAVLSGGFAAGGFVVNHFHNKETAKQQEVVNFEERYRGTLRAEPGFITDVRSLMDVSNGSNEIATSVRCNYFNSLVDKGDIKVTKAACSPPDIEHMNKTPFSEKQKQELRRLIVIEFAKFKLTEDQRETMLRSADFFDQLLDCIDENRCSKKYGMKKFELDIVYFVNAFCSRLKDEFPSQESPDETLAKKLVKNGARLTEEKYPGQTHLFRCDHLRDL